ncbi:hypothetical protein J6590_023995 [Homalodisca vitripennis]|nr:hypothetical protein J6590_023995 [Homalodisca vitripennis]
MPLADSTFAEHYVASQGHHCIIVVTRHYLPCNMTRSAMTSLLADLIKQNKGESRYSEKSMVLIKSARVTDRIRTCAISNSDTNSNVLDHSAIGTPKSICDRL